MQKPHVDIPAEEQQWTLEALREQGRQEGRQQGREALLFVAQSLVAEDELEALEQIDNLEEMKLKIAAYLAEKQG